MEKRTDLVTDTFESVEDNGTVSSFHVVEAVGGNIETDCTHCSHLGEVEERPYIGHLRISDVSEAHGSN